MNEQIKQDIEKMKAAIEQLKASGEDLFAEEIKNLQTKIENAEKEAAAAAENTVQQTEQAASSWWVAHRSDIFNAIEIAALVYIVVRITA
jgi:hypothetical protein